MFTFQFIGFESSFFPKVKSGILNLGIRNTNSNSPESGASKGEGGAHSRTAIGVPYSINRSALCHILIKVENYDNGVAYWIMFACCVSVYWIR